LAKKGLAIVKNKIIAISVIKTVKKDHTLDKEMDFFMQKVEITGIDTSKLETIKNEDMMLLLERVRNGDIEARNAMIKGNLKLILSILKKFHGKKELMDDLFQVGTIGLMKAIDNFDPIHKVRFSTYAVPMIIGEIRRHIRDNSSLRISRSLKDTAYKSIQIRDELFRKNHREPTTEEIAEVMGIDPLDIIMALEAIQDPISIYTPIYDNGNDQIELVDQISDNDVVESDWEKDRLVRMALSKLNKREKSIIHERYFLGRTQIEIAEELGISQAQVSRIEKTALKTMYEKIK